MFINEMSSFEFGIHQGGGNIVLGVIGLGAKVQYKFGFSWLLIAIVLAIIVYYEA